MGKSSFWEMLHWRTEGTTCGSFFTPLINGAAAGSPSVSTADSADLFLIPVSFLGRRQAVLPWLGFVPGDPSPDVQGKQARRWIETPLTRVWSALILKVRLCIGIRDTSDTLKVCVLKSEPGSHKIENSAKGKKSCLHQEKAKKIWGLVF